MTLSEKLVKEFSELNSIHQNEVIDFVEFLKMREEKQIDKLMDLVIDENLEALEELAK